jgi:hypothetical protein
MTPMTRLSTAFLGVALALGLALPSTPALAATPGITLVAKAKPKKGAKKKPKKSPALEKGMKVVTMADAVVVDDPSESGQEVFRASEGQVLTVVKIKKGGAWVRVKDSGGKLGWVHAAEVVPKEVWDAQGDESADGKGKKDKKKKDKDKDKDEGGGEGGGDSGGGDEVASGGGGSDEGGGGGGGSDEGDGGGAKKDRKDKPHDEDGDEGGGGAIVARANLDGKFRIAAGAQLIGLVRNQDFTSDGDKAFSKYTINVSSPGANVFARVARKMGKLELGAQAGFLITFGNGGVTVGSGAGAETLAWQESILDVRLLGGYYLSPDYLVSLRAGYRVMNINIDPSMSIKQPSEQLSGVTLGAQLTAYGFSPKLIVQLGAETMVAASLQQTAENQDGTGSTVSPVYAFLEAGYVFRPKLHFVGGYTLAYETYSFTGPSSRDVSNLNSARTDLQHLFSIGAQLWF